MNNKYVLILHNRNKEVQEIPFAVRVKTPYVMYFDDKDVAEYTRNTLNKMIDKDGIETIVAWDLVEDLVDLGREMS